MVDKRVGSEYSKDQQIEDLMDDEIKFANLDEHSVRFIRSVQHHYGKTVGAEVVHNLQSILGKEWGGRVIFNILSDNHNGLQDFFILDTRHCDRKINAIKELRGICPYLGLKEAKDIVEAAVISPQRVSIQINPTMSLDEQERRMRVSFTELRNIGCNVSV